MGPVNPLFHSLFRQYNCTTGDELCPGGHEWRHLSLHGLPDDPAQLRMWCQGDLVKAPGRLADGWRWKIWWCSGRYWPDQLLGDDCRLHSDMLLQEWLVPNNVNVCLVLSCSQPHGLWWQARISCMHQGGHPGGGQVKVIPSEQLHLEKVLTASGAKYPLAHVVTRHFTLATGANMADMDSLFTEQIPTKVLISLVSNEAFVSTWQKNTFNFAHIKLNSACLVVDGRPLPAQPWQPDFMQGLYAETYHALLKFSGMYPSYWSNGMSVEHFVDGIMLLSWDLTPDDSNGVAYLSPRRLGTVKASLRFAKLLLATTTLIAYAQFDNLVVVDAYQCLHPGTCLHGSRLPTWSTRLMAGMLGNTDWVFFSRTLSMPSTSIPSASHHRSLYTDGCWAWTTWTYGTVQKCYRDCSQGPADSTLSTSWPCAAGVCPWASLLVHSRNTTTVRPRSDAF